MVGIAHLVSSPALPLVNGALASSSSRESTQDLFPHRSLKGTQSGGWVAQTRWPKCLLHADTAGTPDSHSPTCMLSNLSMTLGFSKKSRKALLWCYKREPCPGPMLNYAAMTLQRASLWACLSLFAHPWSSACTSRPCNPYSPILLDTHGIMIRKPSLIILPAAWELHSAKGPMGTFSSAHPGSNTTLSTQQGTVPK